MRNAHTYAPFLVKSGLLPLITKAVSVFDVRGVSYVC